MLFSVTLQKNHKNKLIMSTPHNAAQEGAIAETVIMSGDPLRAKFMAEKFLDNAKCFNTVRNMLGYTGTYQGRPVSVMGHGMGMPSIGIYTYELYHFYGVKQIIRVGTAGCIQKGINIGDIILAQGACTDSNYLHQYGLPGTYAPISDFGLLSRAVDKCKEMGVNYQVGNVLSSDIFYDDNKEWHQWQKMGVLALEMESAALYANAARAGRKALALFTVSDNLIEAQAATAEQRQQAFTDMMEVAFSLV